MYQFENKSFIFISPQNRVITNRITTINQNFFATLECELIDRRCFRTHKEARLAIFSYIEGWYNPHRRHSSIAYHAPITYEKLHLSQA